MTRDPKFVQSMNILDAVEPHGAEVYEAAAAAAAFSDQFAWEDRRMPGQAYIGVEEELKNRIKVEKQNQRARR
jgi:hypothetical protein